MLSVCSQHFRNEILKSQPSHKTAGNMNSVPFLSQLGSGFENCFCPSPKNKTKLQSCHHNKEENFFLTTLQHTTHEGAQSSACLTLVRPDLEVLLTLQTPAALHLTSASLFRFRKASFTYNTRYFFLITQLQLYLIYHFSSWQPLLSERGGICIQRQLHVVVEINDHWKKSHESSSPRWIPGSAGINSSFPVSCPRFVHHGSPSCSVCLTRVCVLQPSSSQSIISGMQLIPGKMHLPPHSTLARFRISKFSAWVPLSSTCRCLVRWYQTW